MAIIKTDDKHYKDIATVLRSMGTSQDATFRPDEFAQGIASMGNYQYTLGYEQGKREPYEMITITTSKTNASDVRDIFTALLNDNENHVIFTLIVNDASALPNNQCISFEYYWLDGVNDSIPVNRWLWTRVRDGKLTSDRNISGEYDMLINSGDVYKKVVL